jgi:hypothetical protein
MKRNNQTSRILPGSPTFAKVNVRQFLSNLPSDYKGKRFQVTASYDWGLHGGKEVLLRAAASVGVLKRGGPNHITWVGCSCATEGRRVREHQWDCANAEAVARLIVVLQQIRGVRIEVRMDLK